MTNSGLTGRPARIFIHHQTGARVLSTVVADSAQIRRRPIATFSSRYLACGGGVDLVTLRALGGNFMPRMAFQAGVMDDVNTGTLL